ncbi:hypothetical protein [endosymbiont of unidentified scaly snail isolate Monju]|uniref:hypothetical protein n=1 Tax=endosymbiont of unidentified scaly snail isolate Monju TaxID=1248727 RepID=UPI0003892217|nr:hypothetical protein [endosymbiont of unidentified scaly snail isolate Monju]BAN68939.1 hypothetical protein EBS_1008 [endosymbiont of unidentified scaly snail isolate Monju]
MKGLLVAAMRGRTQASMAVVVTALLALLLSPLSILSNGLVVLATLRNGPREGVLVAGISVLAMALLGGLLFAQPLVLGALGLMLWLPAWGLALVLGRSGSLMRALEAAVLAGMALVLMQYLLLNDPAAFWGGLLQDYMAVNWDSEVVPEDRQRALLEAMAGWMPGGIGGVWALSAALALMWGRWGQALLAGHEGAFGREFRALRAARPWLWGVLVLLLAGLAGDQPNLAGQLQVVILTLFLLQGLAAAHGVVALAGGKRGWLFGLYFLLIVGLPHSLTAVAIAGYADGWLDFRARVRGDTGGSSGPGKGQ